MTSKLFWLVHVSDPTQMYLGTFLYVCDSLPGEKSVLFHSEKFVVVGGGGGGGGGIAIIESAPGPDL